VEVSGLLSNQALGKKLTYLVSEDATLDGSSSRSSARRRRMIRRPVRLAQSEISALVDEYQRREVSLDELASEFGIHRHTAARHLDSAGVTQRRKAITDEQVQAARHLYENLGWSLARIGEHLGVAPTSANHRLRQAGVQLRPRPGRKQT
jgi:DNA-binding MarR family transcriptional regulator